MRKKHKFRDPDWRKDRFDRSMPKVKKGDGTGNGITVRSITASHITSNWDPMSYSTFDEMSDRGILSQTQINQFHARKLKEFNETPEQNRTKASVSRAKSHKRHGIIVKIANCGNLSTIEGMIAFKVVLKKHPDAINLIGEAQEMLEKD